MIKSILISITINILHLLSGNNRKVGRKIVQPTGKNQEIKWKIEKYRITKITLCNHSLLLFIMTLLCKRLKTNQLQRNSLHLSSFHNNDAAGIFSFNFLYLSPIDIFMGKSDFHFFVLHIRL